MGCNTSIYLPSDVQADNAAKVVGILAGLKPKLKNFERSTGIYAEVEGATDRSSSSSGMSEISLAAPDGKTLVDAQATHSCTFHWSARRNAKIWNLLMPTATPFWCAIGTRLVEWFGGIVVYNDCGQDKAPNVFKSRRHCPVDRYGFIPDDGKAWDAYQNALMKLNPLSSMDLKRGRKVSAYKNGYEADGFTEKATG